MCQRIYESLYDPEIMASTSIHRSFRFRNLLSDPAKIHFRKEESTVNKCSHVFKKILNVYAGIDLGQASDLGWYTRKTHLLVTQYLGKELS